MLGWHGPATGRTKWTLPVLAAQHTRPIRMGTPKAAAPTWTLTVEHELPKYNGLTNAGQGSEAVKFSPARPSVNRSACCPS